MTYPLMLFREGSGELWDGRPTDRLTVENAVEHDAAVADGWMTGPEYHAPQVTHDEAPKRRGRPPKK